MLYSTHRGKTHSGISSASQYERICSIQEYQNGVALGEGIPALPTQPGLIVIGGPTATGKSRQALLLAQRLGSPLLNADSRQVYREFDIGTAKPTLAEQACWPHELIDLADPRETFTVAEFQQAAQVRIAQAHQQGQTPILVGGTGLYIQSITAGLGIPAVPPQPHLRAQLETWPAEIRYAWLQQLDPAAAQHIHPHDAVRTLRALEIIYTTGKTASSLRQAQPPQYPILMLGLHCPMPRLQARIAQRTAQMFQSGWIEEVKQLRERYGPDLPLLNTLGYAEISAYLEGRISEAELQPLIVQHTRQFAKRQMTWFRAMPGIQWLDCEAEDLPDQIEQRVKDWMADLPNTETTADDNRHRLADP
ncbi:tRNA (adenosine(37)-N6)-dimethylallyltransferase MiaA [Thermostichus vulcanus]|uniref:tRNA dimethylallyltransferase n=1 Tax=Thermostichus vulcanus str. 'Rupite' TaxID=2813851 RepID=A0ABT0C686_THEVL|nr:tRNA (adenosine(37)-N6)-dimethylallyltransferase MiaA [Thermostichus vulcanus]MCJ2541311.1 tRNA (adenosine(37)-N6)-dimethylallyltransferase MiaA [Thermostichus vulcanus str. 'Rupite']